jgi:YesN/AraC family two-component response regulator
MNVSFQFALLLSFSEKGANTVFQNKIRTLLLSIKDKVLRLLNVTLTCACPPATMRLEDAMNILSRLKTFRETKLYLPAGTFCVIGETRNLFSNKYTMPSYVKEQIKTLFEMKDFVGLKELIHRIFIDFSDNYISRKKVIEICEKLHDSIRSASIQDDVPNINFQNYEFIGQFEKRIITFIDCFTQNTVDGIKQVHSTAVARAVSYIEEHYQEAISLESCSEDAGISYAHLSRIFKKETSFSFSEYLNHFRVSRAKILLAEKKLPIKQIVEETGFTNYNYFFKVFKDIERITPLEYTIGANN